MEKIEEEDKKNVTYMHSVRQFGANYVHDG